MSEIKVNKVSPATGTAITLGDSGDTFTVPAGATIVNSGTATGFGSSGFTQGSATATTSGTTHDYTSIPAGTDMIVINLFEVSNSGNTSLKIQLGDSGGIETSGYINRAYQKYDDHEESNTDGFELEQQDASSEFSGHCILTLVDSSTNTWAFSGALAVTSATNNNTTSMGVKALSAELDRIRLLNDGGTAFDNGKFNIMYQ